ncbi:unnamed protein product, partial [Porites lobata]
FLSTGPGCGALLTRDIVNRTIQTTTAFNSSVDEKYAILNSSSAWCSSDLDTFQYLRINIGKQAHLTGLDIQGKRFSNQYITQFKVGYKTDDTQRFPQFYPSDSNPKVFQMAPVSGDEIMHFSLNNTVMKSLFIFPSQWNKHICIRIELYGCVPVDGGFTSWSDWSCCSRSCGNGTKVRYRSCTNPAPANGGLGCTGERNQTESCLGTSCPGNCVTASIQIAECNPESQVQAPQTRPPRLPPDRQLALFSVIPRVQILGHACKIANCLVSSQLIFLTMLCSIRSFCFLILKIPKTVCFVLFVVDGGFSNWSNWTKCSVTCGTGFQLRTRSCTNPLPEHGGKLCAERSSGEGRNCTLQPC